MKLLQHLWSAADEIGNLKGTLRLKASEYKMQTQSATNPIKIGCKMKKYRNPKIKILISIKLNVRNLEYLINFL